MSGLSAFSIFAQTHRRGWNLFCIEIGRPHATGARVGLSLSTVRSWSSSGCRHSRVFERSDSGSFGIEVAGELHLATCGAGVPRAVLVKVESSAVGHDPGDVEPYLPPEESVPLKEHRRSMREDVSLLERYGVIEIYSFTNFQLLSS